ncbi:HEAT repeat domain-containing protein [Streptomyces sp. CC208A]|uniref:HEAT repeat domain-containing protein n=1 Tax=Streptomyces sp. CC208A TaxID=3044573 RepID=UPI0024A7C451|nr:HEAT repeat domain-containing protein [Streptomyces sp. CC208A]
MSPTPNPTPNPHAYPSGPVPASPEEALARVAAGEPPVAWRGWPAGVLVPAVRVALLGAELVREPAVLRREERGEALYQAVRGVGVASAELVGELAGSGDGVLEGEALRLAREGLREGVLAPGFVREVLSGLTGAASAAVVNGALAGLAEPWAVAEPLAAELPERLLAPATAEAALAVAVAHGHGGPLWRAAGDPDVAPRVRRRALALYGETARRDDVPAVLALAGTGPLLLGGPAVDCLRALHRRGHFVTDADLPAVLDLALADHTIPARAVATVLYTCRRSLLRLLVAAAPDAPDWPRRLDLLVALDEQGVADLPVAAEIARVLPDAAKPGPFLHALRALRDPATEDAVLDALPHAPADALDALEAVGGDRTVRVLAAALGPDVLDGVARPGDAPASEDVERAVRAFRPRALELVWLLTTDPGVRRRLLARIDGAELPARIAADLGGPDERELALLSLHLDPDRPVDALRRIAEHADAGGLPVLADLLLRIAGEAAAAWEPGAAGPVPDAEPAVPPEAVSALVGLGRRWYARRRIRPLCLLDASDAATAGQALAADLALGLLDRPGLTAGEQRVLLRLLLDLPQAPHHRIRPRVHRHLRHPDRHVRKHAVALLARDGTGDGVEAVSATLLALTGPDRDPQTVRQTLGALGDAGARWASDALSACLGHPAMNVRKTAARALATAGTARAVPHLLHRLGHDDNPGLRTHLLDALRALLGDTLTATVTAAADRATDTRVGDRLLAALPTTPDPDPDETDLRRLTGDGWDPDAALRLAERHTPAAGHRAAYLRELRPYLRDWLELAGTSARARRAVLGVLPNRVCPGPWEVHERDAFARHVTVLLDGLAEAEGEARDTLIALLEAAAPHPRPGLAAEVAAGERALPPCRPGRRSTLPLLRLVGAVPVRADLDRELAAAALASDPEAARARLLRETFGIGEAGPRPPWYGELVAAVRSVPELAAHRERSAAVGSRELLAALVDVQAGAPPDVRAALVDWMTELQPLAVPPWTLAETARAEVSPARVARPADLDQPRSAAQRERLLALLASDAPDRRNTAARALLAWPEPDVRATVLDVYLRGRIDEPADPALRTALGHALAETDPASLLGDGVRPDRVARIAATACDVRRLPSLLPVLLHLWRHGPEGARADAFTALRRPPADLLAGHLESGAAPGLLVLLAGRSLRRTPALDRLSERHPEAGLVLVDGPPHGPEAAERQAAALRALRERAPAPAAPASSLPYEELVTLLRSPEPLRVRRALAQLTEHAAEFEPTRLAEPLRELLSHPVAGVRLHAHRVSRALLDRETHLRLTEVLLDDPRPDVVRGAIRVLSRARWRPAVPVFVALLDHGRPTVRRTAEEAVLHAGRESVPSLRRAAAHARPDRRAAYERLLARVGEGETAAR